MAISLDELAAVALEGTVGPMTLAVGASALALALAAGSTRPLRRLAATSVVAFEQTGQIRPTAWIASLRRGWASLVDEARSEYESGRRRPAPGLGSPILVANAAGQVHETVGVAPVPAALDPATLGELTVPGRTRDGRGRFTRRSQNGVQPE